MRRILANNLTISLAAMLVAEATGQPWSTGTEYNITSPIPLEAHCYGSVNGSPNADHYLGLSEDNLDWVSSFWQHFPCEDAGIQGSDCCEYFGAHLTRCYSRLYEGYDGVNLDRRFGREGYARGIDLGWGVSQGDYPPLSTDVRASTSPLVPAGAALGQSSFYPERPRVDQLDLITGQPLLREVDLELPFGGAVYRQIRTYSEHPWIAHERPRDTHDSRVGTDLRVWDWHGQGWMTGENPLFLFDASWLGVVNAGDVGNPSGSPTRCYFAPDAHHAIPFEQVDLDGGRVAYVAPSQFDALLTHSGGIWDSQSDSWVLPPSEFKVYLHDRSVIYTIKPYYEDYDPDEHLRAAGHGDETDNKGVPYYGLVTRIEDRAGNAAVIRYADGHQPTERETADQDQPGCLQCEQKCHLKGLIERVELFASGAQVPSWTLVYTYRTFAQGIEGDHINGVPDLDYWGPYSFSPMVHSIIVYEGAVDPVNVTRELILPTHTTFEASEEPYFVFAVENEELGGESKIVVRPLNDPTTGNPLDRQDTVIGPTGHGGDPQGWANIPGGWSYVLEYRYSEPECYGEYTNDAEEVVAYENTDDFYQWAVGSAPLQNGGWSLSETGRREEQAAYLVRASVATVFDPEDVNQGMNTRYSIYRYQDIDYELIGSGSDAPSGYSNLGFGSSEGRRLAARRLKATMGPATVGRLIETRPDQNVSPSAYVNSLIGLQDRDGVPVLQLDESTGQPTTVDRPLWSSFDTTFLQWNQPYHFVPNTATVASWLAYDGEAGSGTSPFRTRLRHAYFGVGSSEESLAFEDNCGSEATATTGFLPDGAAVYSGRDSSGSRRFYRVYRYVRVPDGLTSPSVPFDSWRHNDADGTYETPAFDTFPGPEVLASMGISGPTHVSASRSLYHHPFRFTSDWYGTEFLDQPNYPNAGPAQVIPLSMPMWFTVIDEYPSLEDAVLKDSIEVGRGIDYSDPEPWLSRRVVSMNPAGLVLTDRTWSGGGLDDNSPHLAEAYKYDDWGRLIERRTLGWAVAATDQPNTISAADEGLCFRYVYAETPSTPPGETPADGNPISTEIGQLWLKRGSASPGNGDEGDVLLNSLSYYTAAQGAQNDDLFRDGMLHKVTQYNYARDEVGANEYRYWFQPWTLTEHDENGNELQDADERPPLKRKIVAGPAYARDLSGTQYRSFVREDYDAEGRLAWKSYGSMQDPFGSSQVGDEIFVDFAGYDDQGRLTLEIVDLDTGNVSNFAPPNLIYGNNPQVISDFEDALAVQSVINARTSLLEGLTRQAAAPPLQETTFRRYGNFGPTLTVHPDGRRDLIKYRVFSQRLQELRAMGVEFDGTDWSFLSPGWISDFSGADYVKSTLALLEQLNNEEWNGSPEELNEVFFDGGLQVIAEVEPGYDASGRLTGISISNPEDTNEQFASSTFMDSYGNVIRERNADGQITRNRYDLLGRMHKTFRGTVDLHEAWGTAAPGAEDDDMLLVEKVHYGRGVHDAGEVIHRWSFHALSGNQYLNSEFLEPSEGGDLGYQGEAYSSGQHSGTGQRESYAHDWRMRRTDTGVEDLLLDPVNPVLHRSVRTWLDNQNRVRVRAVFAGATPSGVPDADVLPEDVSIGTGSEGAYWDSTISGVLGAGINPLDGGALISLDETIYNDAGQVSEQRRYDVSSTTPAWLATRTWYNHQGKPLRTEAPNGDVTTSIYDAKGRLIRASSWAGTTELVRTENFYGRFGTLDAVQVWERLEGASTSGDLDSLAITDKTLSTTFNWYNSNGRLVATADLGSWSDLGTLEDWRDPGAVLGGGDVLAARPTDPPAIIDTTVLVQEDTVTGATEVTREDLVGFVYPTEFGFDQGDHGRARAQIRCYAYDARGNMAATLQVRECIDHDPTTGFDIEQRYTVTRSYFDSYGRLVLTLDEAFEGDNSAAGVTSLGRQRGTAYRYDGSRVTDIAAVLDGHVLVEAPSGKADDELTSHDEGSEPTGEWRADWSLTDGTLQVTHILYGAPVVSPAVTLAQAVAHFKTDNPALHPYASEPSVVVSHRADLPLAVWYPDPITGLHDPSDFPDLRFTYYADGKVATRADARGVVFLYSYDDDGNLARVRVDDTGLPILNLVTDPATQPHNRLEFEHDERGALTLATSYRDDTLDDGAPGTIVQSQSQFSYDAWGNLLAEIQSRDDPADPSSPTVSYAWDITPMTSHAQWQQVGFNRSRLDSITYPDRASMGTWGDSSATPPARTITYDYGAPGSLDDLLSRVRTLTASGGPAGAEIGHVATYSYHGRSRLTQTALGSLECGGPGGPLVNAVRDTRSLDAFGRVLSHLIEGYDDTTTDCNTPLYQQIHRYDYGYDEGGFRRYAHVVQQDTSTESRDNTHSALYALDPLGRISNAEIGTLDTTNYDSLLTGGGQAWDSYAYLLDSLGNRNAGSAQVLDFVHDTDADGDGVFEATEGYETQIDLRNAVNALEIYNASTYTRAHDEIGSLISDGHQLPSLLYDAWGRLAYWSFYDPSVSGFPFYGMHAYDALGRLSKRSAPWPDDYNLSRVETYYYDGVRRIQEVFDDPVHAETPWADPFGTPPPPQTPQSRMEREYIWAAHDTAGVNELHVAIDWFDREAWPIQDPHNQSVYGYTDPVGELVEQRVYAPFGQILSADKTPLAKPSGLYFDFRLRVGMHGMFAERLDASTTDPLLRHADARVVYLTPNRTYDPKTGLWWQRDPNATGLLTQGSLDWGGGAVIDVPARFDVAAHYTDGLSLSEFVGANSIERSDPTGLFFSFGDLGGANAIRSDLQSDAGDVQFDIVSNLMSMLNPDVGFALKVGKASLDVVRIGSIGFQIGGKAGKLTVGAVASKLTASDKVRLRTNARKLYTGLRGQRPSDAGVEVHHMIPLEWSHLFSSHPNSLSNLAAIPVTQHRRINGEWNSFRSRWSRQGIDPEPYDVRDFASYISRKYGRYMDPL